MSPAPSQEAFKSYTESGHGREDTGAGLVEIPLLVGPLLCWSWFLSISHAYTSMYASRPVFPGSPVHKAQLKSEDVFNPANEESMWDPSDCQDSLWRGEGFAVLGYM